ncbi:MAG: hypothetical protein IK104_04175, partial [Clostridia bacterium]|nr:hypothetical protein [Clostridia bacterium]
KNLKKMARCQSIFNLSADNLRLVELCAGVLLGVLSLKSVLLGVLRHERNLFCLPRQKRFFLAFWAKNRQNTVKSGFGAVDQSLWSPFFCVQRLEQPENAGVLFAFLCSAKNEQKVIGGRT